MKVQWQTRTFGEVLQETETINPLSDPGREFEYVDVSSVSNKIFEIVETQRLKGRDAPSRARRVIRRNDILFATVRPTLQRIALVPGDLDQQVCSTGFYVLRPKEIIHYKYLFYWLLSTAFLESMASLQKGASYPAVNDGEVRAQRISYPPIVEQRRIVGILDEAFEGIAKAKVNAEKNLQNARALFESYLDGIFAQHGSGWAEKSLEELADPNCTLSYGIVQPGEEYPDGLPVVRPTDLTTKLIQLDGLKRIDPKLAEAYKRTVLLGGELLLCVRGTTGLVSIASAELVGGNVTRGIVPIRFNKALLMPEFGFYLLSSGAFQSQIREKTYGAALMQINIRDLRNITLWFPPLKEQEGIASKLDDLYEETQRLESIYRQKLAELEELKKSMLHDAFAGAL